MTIKSVKRLAADIMGVGVNRIKMSPENAKKAAEALTRADVRGLLEDKTINVLEKPGRKKKERKRQRGSAHRKGRPSGDKKKQWMVRLRSQRKYLKELLKSGTLERKHKWAVYGRVKSGLFRNKKTMLAYLKENNMLNAEVQIGKTGVPAQ